MLDDFFDDDEDKNDKKSLLKLITSRNPPNKSLFEYVEPEPLKIPEHNLPRYFDISTDILLTLEKIDLQNLLKDDFDVIKDVKLRQCLLSGYKGMYVRKTTKDVIKEILSDIRANESKPKTLHWSIRSVLWFLGALLVAFIGALASSYIPEIRNLSDCILGIEACESGGDDSLDDQDKNGTMPPLKKQ
ncbi:MAG: hypothetical protein DWP95_10290 [Proteobacteria bacterium]|nr:MAG: hypothetical protein DWP95_10290 [Pseudomonadota bacterium]